MFSARDYSVLNQISENLNIPELRKTIAMREIHQNSTYNIHSVEGPDLHEIQRLIKYMRNIDGLQIDEHNLYKLSDWMVAENIKCRDWLTRLNGNGGIGYSGSKKKLVGSLHSAIPNYRLKNQMKSLVGLHNIKLRVSELRSWLEIQKKRSFAGNQPLLHMMFLGNPGTGKTHIRPADWRDIS